MPQIADTGFLVAYWNRRDVHHGWARSLPLRAPLLTCAPVLTEAAYLLGQPEPIVQMLVDGDLVSAFDLDVHAPELLRWLERYADHSPGLTDACVVRLAEVTPRAEVLTTDKRDFSMYRTLGGQGVAVLLSLLRQGRVAAPGERCHGRRHWWTGSGGSTTEQPERLPAMQQALEQWLESVARSLNGGDYVEKP